MKKFDYLIVGQGLAGSVLALQLLWNGKKVMVINDENIPSSSIVAAGLWNPVVFKRLTKSWMLDELIPELNTFYSNTEKELETNFVSRKKITKLFIEEQEKTLWVKKAITELNSYIDPKIYQQHTITNNDYSFVLQSGNIDLPKFLNEVKKYLTQKGAYSNQTFEYAELNLNAMECVYKNLTTSQIIFCEGYGNINNPYFKFVPLKPAKGEVITIHCEALKLNDILSKGIFILPLGNNVFKVGATYEWTDLSDLPTEKGRKEIIEKLNKIIDLPYTIIDHQAGVRPSVIDRRPILGSHPIHKNLKIFNGLGTKGVMLAPWFATHFINHLIKGSEILKEVNVERFYSYTSAPNFD